MEKTNIKDTFLRYENARQSGNYNMITDARQVMLMYNIDKEDYFYIIKNYSELSKKYL